ncbi:hypothetical protein MPDQ_004072 [Monascus purpureus]|uniref:Transcriptional regulatory protein DEP1 n=1 Tax=Monascus purpureus TaxID=5098 RepID=A0A507QYL0_MONPU|nr:hypothetical protein MPDQ_004072 [Monascus purpureus]BDD57867.1 hypothetical protein MAP00_003193 [Monascus purpureus]
MEVAGGRESASVGPPTTQDSAIANGDEDYLLTDPYFMDDGRSSSLSEIDDVSDDEPLDYDLPKPEKPAPENDSEAETERVDDSPSNLRLKRDIVLSAGGPGPSPSKLAQSTTYDDIEDDDGDRAVVDSPSRPQRPSRNESAAQAAEDTPAAEDTVLSLDGVGKKRKRAGSDDDTGTDLVEEEPLKKRRGSVKSDLSEPALAETPLSPQQKEDHLKAVDEGTPAEDVPELDLPAMPAKSKKGKKNKRKGKRAREMDEEIEAGASGEHPEDDETADRGEEAEDAEAIAKHEEEAAKRISAMESLAVLEREFASLRDKIYDERISKLNNELDMLTGPNPTHPEYLRQLESVKRYCDAKINYEHTLFRYRIKSLLNKSLAERAQIHSTYFQRVRDARERHSSAVSRQFYAIQHDRFKTEELSPNQSIPFPTRRSQQIAQQTAYNQEVSIMAGVAKYIGFPAAPSLTSARPSELDEDLEKMGISVEPRYSALQSSTAPRGAMSAMPSNLARTAAEEAFLEHTPWANPQHPIHQQQGQQRVYGRVFEHPNALSVTTPAAQKRAVDINAPNGSASTIPENMSAANSSAANTPFGTEQEQRLHSHGQFGNPDYEMDRRTGFRSLSSSPLDVRKPHPHAGSILDHHRSHQGIRSDTGARNNAYSPPASRLGLFHSAASKRDTSPPPLSSRQVSTIHHPAGVSTTSGSSMAAR